MMTATEVSRPGTTPKGIPRARLKSARKKRVKHSHILTSLSLTSFTQITFLRQLSADQSQWIRLDKGCSHDIFVRQKQVRCRSCRPTHFCCQRVVFLGVGGGSSQLAGQMYILPEASMPQAGGGVQYKFTNPRVVLYPRILYTDIVMFV